MDVLFLLGMCNLKNENSVQPWYYQVLDRNARESIEFIFAKGECFVAIFMEIRFFSFMIITL